MQFAIFSLLSIFAFAILLILFSGIQAVIIMTPLMEYMTAPDVEHSNYLILLLSFLISFSPVALHALKIMKGER